MFSNLINQTALTTPFADAYFSKISGSDYMGDKTFITTLRALLADRIGEDSPRIRIYNSYTVITKANITSWGIRDALSNATGGFDLSESGAIFLDNISSAGKENVEAIFKLINEEFAGRYNGWKRVEKVTAFFQKSFGVTCFINDDLKSVFIAVENMDLRRYHYLQCAIFAFLPWYFDVKTGLTPEERKLIESLLQTDSSKYMECIAEFASKYDFREASIRKMLDGFEHRYERQRMSVLEREINDLISALNDYNREISKVLKNKRDKEYEMLGIGLKISEDGDKDSEIMNYFLSNKRLVLESVSDTDISFGVKDYLVYYDEDQARATLFKQGGYVDTCHIGSISVNDMRELLSAIFLEGQLKLRVCAKYTFRLTGNVAPMQHAQYGIDYDGYMPNTHIDQFGCMGNYSATINQLLQRNDYIGALEQCIASCKSLNFVDYSVMRRFIEAMYNSGVKCIELPDGSIVNSKNAIKYLKEQNKAEGEE